MAPPRCSHHLYWTPSPCDDWSARFPMSVFRRYTLGNHKECAGASLHTQLQWNVIMQMRWCLIALCNLIHSIMIHLPFNNSTMVAVYFVGYFLSNVGQFLQDIWHEVQYGFFHKTHNHKPQPTNMVVWTSFSGTCKWTWSIFCPRKSRQCVLR